MSRSLKDTIALAHGIKATKELPADDERKLFEAWLLPRREAWYRRPESERVWTPEALEFARKVINGELQHVRTNRVSPSSMGTDCERELLFGFAGAPQLLRAPSNVDKMESGSFEHLRWQMAGLSAGYLAECEGFIISEDLRCGGSMDGICEDGSLFEFKNTASHLYLGIVENKGRAAAYAQDMHRKHLLQMEAYFLVDSVQEVPRLNGYASLVYQDRDSKATKEFRIHTSPSRRAEVHRILEGLHDWIDIDDLPDMLEGCAKASSGEVVSDKEHRRYVGCQYREYCPTATTVKVLS